MHLIFFPLNILCNIFYMHQNNWIELNITSKGLKKHRNFFKILILEYILKNLLLFRYIDVI